MNDKQLLELWEMRFTRILNQEREALVYYKRILEQHGHILDGTRVKQIIRKIMRQEAGHIAIAKKLLEIVEANRKQRTSREAVHVS